MMLSWRENELGPTKKNVYIIEIIEQYKVLSIVSHFKKLKQGNHSDYLAYKV